jgi:putative membrane protein
MKTAQPISFIVLMSALAAGVAIAADKADKNSDQPSAQSQGSSSNTVSSEERKFMEKAAQANMAEIETGKLAAEKASNADVKQFGLQMVNEHTKALNELRAIAQKKGVNLPKEPDKAHKEAAKELQSLSGSAFDRRYLSDAGLKDHNAALQLFQEGAARSRDPEVKAYAEKVLPDVRHHLQMAQEIAKKVTAAR